MFQLFGRREVRRLASPPASPRPGPRDPAPAGPGYRCPHMGGGYGNDTFVAFIGRASFLKMKRGGGARSCVWNPRNSGTSGYRVPIPRDGQGSKG